MADRVCSPCSPAADARSVARGISRLRLPALLGAVLLCLAQPATARSNVPKLISSNPAGSAQQGFSVAVSADGTTAIVGGPSDNSGAGAAWVFTRSGGTWTQQQKLTAGDANGAAEQGFSVAVSADGTTAIVGGPFDNSGAGAAWVFTRNGGTWARQQKLTPGDATGAAQLGWSVALSADGTTAIVGGPGDNNSIGAAWVFTRTGSMWSQQGAKFSGTGAAGTGCAPGVVGKAEQGYSVALSRDGNTAIVGGWADNGSLGAAWVFTRSGGMWGQPGAKLCGSGATASTNILQGFSVALSDDGTTAIVGGPGDNDSIGAAWVFTLSGGKWTQQGRKLVDSDGDESQQGFSVALSGDGGTVIVGGPGEETPGTGTSATISVAGKTETTVNMSNGAVWVFTRSGDGTWRQQGGMLAATSAVTSNPGQGFSVALAGGGNTALVGGPTDNANTGIAWVFVSLNGAATHDFNGDGKSDVLWRDTSGAVAMWLMNGKVVLQSSGLGSVAGNWSIVGQRDFNGDRKADILWRDTAGDVAIWLMDGPNILSSAGLGNVSTDWSIAGTGDFNGDGNADILWLDNQGDLGIWFMSGTQILKSAGVGQLPANSTVVGSDMNGDIFLRNTVSGDVSMWVMNGAQIARKADLGPVPLNWSVAGIGEFDGKGSFDILWREAAGDVGMWLMNGASVISSTVLGNVPPNWSIVQTGGYNGAGKSDILWVDNLGNLGVWFMNGTAIASTFFYGNVSTAWTVQSLNAD